MPIITSPQLSAGTASIAGFVVGTTAGIGVLFLEFKDQANEAYNDRYPARANDTINDTLSDFVDVYTSGADTYIGVDQDGAGGFTDVVKLEGAASTIDDLIDFTSGTNLIVI